MATAGEGGTGGATMGASSMAGLAGRLARPRVGRSSIHRRRGARAASGADGIAIVGRAAPMLPQTPLDRLGGRLRRSSSSRLGEGVAAAQRVQYHDELVVDDLRQGSWGARRRERLV